MPTDKKVSGPGGWQNEYALQDWQKHLTQLTPQEEAGFQTWVAKHNVPVTPDYDMRGFYAALQAGDKNATQAVNPVDGQLHFTDRWKTPLHKSFSGESIYSIGRIHGPYWQGNKLLSPEGEVLFDDNKQAYRELAGEMSLRDESKPQP